MTTEKDFLPNREEDYENDTLTNKHLLAEHEYDGIRELDNKMPFWLRWLFYLSILFAIVYLVRFFIFKSEDLYQLAEYNKEVAKAGERPSAAGSETFEIVLLEDDASLASGKETWEKTCAVCHMADGGGLVGPNMTDKYWIHGNTLEDIMNVISNGVIEKGMIPYKDQIPAQKRLEVASYILARLQGSTPANPKEPQGDLYE